MDFFNKIADFLVGLAIETGFRYPKPELHQYAQMTMVSSCFEYQHVKRDVLVAQIGQKIVLIIADPFRASNEFELTARSLERLTQSLDIRQRLEGHFKGLASAAIRSIERHKERKGGGQYVQY